MSMNSPAIKTITTGTLETQNTNGMPKKMKNIAVANTIN